MEIGTLLPFEVRELIFNHLLVRDLVSLSLVCRSLHDVMNDEFWRDILHKRLRGPLIVRRGKKTALQHVRKALLQACAACERVKMVIFNEYTGIRLCSHCMSTTEHDLLTAQAAKKLLDVKDSELEQMPFPEQKYPFSRPWAVARLYSAKDIREMQARQLEEATSACLEAESAWKRPREDCHGSSPASLSKIPRVTVTVKGGHHNFNGKLMWASLSGEASHTANRRWDMGRYSGYHTSGW